MKYWVLKYAKIKAYHIHIRSTDHFKQAGCAKKK